jgi:hypothetical protein
MIIFQLSICLNYSKYVPTLKLTVIAGNFSTMDFKDSSGSIWLSIDMSKKCTIGKFQHYFQYTT